MVDVVLLGGQGTVRAASSEDAEVIAEADRQFYEEEPQIPSGILAALERAGMDGRYWFYRRFMR